MTQIETKTVASSILAYNIALTKDVIGQFNKDIAKVISAFIKEDDRDNLHILTAKLIVLYNQEAFDVDKESQDFMIYEWNIMRGMKYLQA